MGPKVACCAAQETEGIEISQLDLKSAVANEILCKNRFTSKAPSFGHHPGLAIDFSTGWDFDEPDQEAEAFRLRETMRPKLLVGQNLFEGQKAARSEAHALFEASGGSRADVSRTGGRPQLPPS